jgi:glucan phosphoethanolaminetransferase (alkaline phosphatase superfamily)
MLKMLKNLYQSSLNQKVYFGIIALLILTVPTVPIYLTIQWWIWLPPNYLNKYWVFMSSILCLFGSGSLIIFFLLRIVVPILKYLGLDFYAGMEETPPKNKQD